MRAAAVAAGALGGQVLGLLFAASATRSTEALRDFLAKASLFDVIVCKKGGQSAQQVNGPSTSSPAAPAAVTHLQGPRC